MKRIFILLAMLVVGNVYAGNDTDKERYAECILDNIKGVTSDFGAKVVVRGCRERYPSWSKPSNKKPNEPFAKCLLKGIKGVSSDTAAKLIFSSCQTLHPPKGTGLTLDELFPPPEKKPESNSETLLYPTDEEWDALFNANFCVIGLKTYPNKFSKEDCRNANGIDFDQERHARTHVQYVKYGSLPKTARCYLKNELQTVAVADYTIGLMALAAECDARFGGNKAKGISQVLDKYQRQLDQWGNLDVMRQIASRWGLTSSGYSQSLSIDAIKFFRLQTNAGLKTACSGLDGKIKNHDWRYIKQDFIPLVKHADTIYPLCN